MHLTLLETANRHYNIALRLIFRTCMRNEMIELTISQTFPNLSKSALFLLVSSSAKKEGGKLFGVTSFSR